MHHSNAGLEAEQLAATFLENHGLKLVAKNYHCRFGEIDIIMIDAETLVFIEVRLRSNSQFGSAAASITPQKQQKLILTAQHYLQLHVNNQSQVACRFDAILMRKTDLNDIEWLRNAFET